MSVALEQLRYAWQYTTLMPAPDDLAPDREDRTALHVLWALAMLHRPRSIVYLGSDLRVAQVLTDAARRRAARCVAVSADDACAFWDVPDLLVIRESPERVQANLSPEMLVVTPAWVAPERTWRILRTWVEDKVSPGCVTAWRPINNLATPEPAATPIDAWLLDHPAWIWHRLATDLKGLGLLWKPE